MLPKLDPSKRIYIAFDGIMANSDVYCNGELLGHRPYGYVSFNSASSVSRSAPCFTVNP